MIRFARLLFAACLAGYGAAGAVHTELFWFLDGANLLFHEAGHPVFGLLGTWPGMLGGTLMQLLVPAGVALAFWKKGDRYGASIMSFWFGENFIHIARYVRDARAQELPLVGGGIHDWHYLLGRAGLLAHDQTIGGLFWLMGVGVMGLAVYGAWKSGGGTVDAPQ